MNMHIQPAPAGTTPLCPIVGPLDTARAKTKFRVGEIVRGHDRLAVVLPCAPTRGKQFFRYMHSEEVEGKCHSRIFYTLKSNSLMIERLEDVTPTLELEESGCRLHTLLTATEAGEVISEFVDMPSFEATLTGWYETLRSIPAGSLDVLRNILDGSRASDRLLEAYEKAA
jgi:hypothetical protein